MIASKDSLPNSLREKVTNSVREKNRQLEVASTSNEYQGPEAIPRIPENWKGAFLPISTIAELYQVKYHSIKNPIGKIRETYFYLKGKAFREIGSCGYCQKRTGSKPAFEYNPEHTVIKDIINRVKNNARPARRRKT